MTVRSILVRPLLTAVICASVPLAAALNLGTGVDPEAGFLRRPPVNAFARFVENASDFSQPPPAKGVEAPRMQDLALKMPLSFEAHREGAETRFVSRGAGYSLSLAPGEAVLRLRNSGPALTGSKSTRQSDAVVHLQFSGANHNARIHGVDRLPSVSNYYRGSDPSSWRTGIPHFAKVRYQEIYPGIDLVFYGRGREFEFDLVVAPGADPDQILIELHGPDRTTLDASGNLVLQTQAGPLRLRKPVVYQEIDGQRREVEGRFSLRTTTHNEADESPIRKDTVAFQLAKYDATQPLIIDPVADFTGGLGGTKGDTPLSVSALPGGLICAVGSTTSLDFPITPGATQPTNAAPTGVATLDAWIAFLNGDGTQIISSTYFGGDGDDEALAVAVDQFGIAHVTGYTQSDNFPVLGSLAHPYGGLGDAFMAAFSISGASLYSLYYGGSGVDQGNGIAVGTDGNIHVSGWTTSTDLPVVNPFQPTNAGAVDFFVAELERTASRFDWATYLGGNNREHPSSGLIANGNYPSGGIDVDSAGNSYVTGSTSSFNFPKVNAYSANASGVFVSKFNPTGSALLYSSGFGPGQGYGIDVESTADNGQVLLAGRTTSPDFWPLRNASHTTYGGSSDAVVAQVDTTKSGDASLMYSSYLGDDGDDEAYDVQFVKITGINHAAVTGRTNSTSFPGTTERSGGSILKSIDAGATWTKSNKGIASADFSSAVQVNCMAVDVLNPQIAYAGTEHAGVFKTADGGANWASMNTGLEAIIGDSNGSVTALGIDPANSSRIFAGTAFQGIYVTENGGANWTARNSGLQTNAPFVSFVFGGGAVYVGSDFNGVFKTTDNGLGWTPMNTGLTDLRVKSLAIDPADPNRLLAGTGGRSSPSGVYGSFNGGASWSHYNGNLSDVMGPSRFTDLFVTAILLLGDDARTLFALVQSSSERIGGLATSYDFGQTWTALARFGDPAQVFDPEIGFKDAYSARALWVDPNNRNNILIGTNGDPGFAATAPEAKDSGRGILRSTDGGQNWSVTGGVGINVNALALGLTAGDPSAWYAATTGGNDGFITTLRLDGTGVSTDVVGGTGEDALRSLSTLDPAVDLGITTSYLTATGVSSSLDLDRTPGAVQPLPNTIPPGIVIPPVQPANATVLAQRLGAAPALNADVAITKEMTFTDSGGQKVVFCRITVTNNGPDTARNVKVDEHGSAFKTAATDSTSNPTSTVSPANQNTRSYDLGDIAPGATKEIALFFPVYGGNGDDLGKTRRNIALVYMESDEVADPTASNDVGFAEITIPQTPPGDIPPQTANQSTRVVVRTGDGAPNSGTIITGGQQQRRAGNEALNATANEKRVIFRAIGPSLQSGGTPVEGRLEDPTLELYDANGEIIATNDNWRETQIGGIITSDQEAEIEATTIPPTNDLESAIVAHLTPAVYTAVIRGAADTTGIALAEVYDLDSTGELRLANISTRGFVDTGGNVMIGGVILLGTESQRIVFRAIGPSLTNEGVSDALQDPVLDVVNGNGSLVRSNDDWRSDQEAELIATTIPPSNDAEAAIVEILAPGAYTAVVSGAGRTIGVGLVEVYNLGAISSNSR